MKFQARLLGQIDASCTPATYAPPAWPLTIVFAPHVSALPPHDKRSRPESQFYLEVRVEMSVVDTRKKSVRHPRWNGCSIESCVKLYVTFALHTMNINSQQLQIVVSRYRQPYLDFRF